MPAPRQFATHQTQQSTLCVQNHRRIFYFIHTPDLSPTTTLANMLKIYADMMSQPSRAVVLFARINDIPHTVERVRLLEGEHKSDVNTSQLCNTHTHTHCVQMLLTHCTLLASPPPHAIPHIIILCHYRRPCTHTFFIQNNSLQLHSCPLQQHTSLCLDHLPCTYTRCSH